MRGNNRFVYNFAYIGKPAVLRVILGGEEKLCLIGADAHKTHTQLMCVAPCDRERLLFKLIDQVQDKAQVVQA